MAMVMTGPRGSTWNPSHMLLTDNTVFFQLSGVPMARRRRRMAFAWSGACSRRRSQRKSSTKTKPQSSHGNA